MDEEIISSYEAIFKRFWIVDSDEYVAKEAIQMTMLKMLVLTDEKLKIRSPRNFIINSSKFFSKDIKRGSTAMGKSSTYYDSETTEMVSDEGGSTTEYQNKIESTDFGQIFSFEDQYDIDIIKKALGKDFDFVIENISFSTGSRPSVSGLRGVTGVSNRPREYDSDKDRYKMAYIRKKVNKMFNNGYKK